MCSFTEVSRYVGDVNRDGLKREEYVLKYYSDKDN